MDKATIQTVLQSIHEIEQAEGRMIPRRELHKHMSEGLSFVDKKLLIKSWQNTYFARYKNMSDAQTRSIVLSQLAKTVTNDGHHLKQNGLDSFG